MSKCNIVLKEERNSKKEIVLYRNNDGHPDIMVDMLTKILYETYSEFESYGDIDWFLDSSILASKIVLNSIPKLPSNMADILELLDDTTTKKKFNMYMNMDMPTIYPETYRVPNCNYEYTIILKESIVDGKVFRGYSLEVVKIGTNNKKVQDILSLDINLNSRELDLITS